MSQMISYMRIGSPELQPRQYNLNALHPFGGLNVALEQLLYIKYVSSTTNIDPVDVDRLKIQLSTFIQSLPPRLFNGNIFNPINNLYQAGKNIANTLLGNLTLLADAYFDLNDIFKTSSQTEYIDREYLPTINAKFIDELFAIFYGFIDSEKYPRMKIGNGQLFVPSLSVQTNYDPHVSSQDNKNQIVILSLDPINFGELDPVGLNNVAGVKNDSYLNLIKHFDLSKFNLDNLVGILANFSIDHNYYGMTNLHKYNVADVCFDLVTESAWVSTGKNHLIEDQNEFIDLCKYMIQNHKIQDINDYALFGELLRILDVPSEIVNYFIKPITSIQSTEAFAFRNSIYAEFVKDRFGYGMEAIDDAESTTNEDDTEPDDSNESEQEETSDETEDANNEDDEKNTSSQDSENPDESDESSVDDKEKQDIHKPSIDPTMMLLEMASPDETLSDYIFRETVSMRIDNFLKNPPENASPNDLLMLKRWRSSWMWLTSISCLKDFLTRLSLRLSNP